MLPFPEITGNTRGGNPFSNSTVRLARLTCRLSLLFPASSVAGHRPWFPKTASSLLYTDLPGTALALGWAALHSLLVRSLQPPTLQGYAAATVLWAQLPSLCANVC